MEATTLTPNDIKIDSTRCSKIYCKNGGHILYRNLDPSVRWDVIYHRAILNPKEFDVEYDKEIASSVDDEGQIHWVERDLKLKSMPELRKIGSAFNVTARDKDQMVKNIMAAQAKLDSQKKELE
jgi:hypothetical protein